MTIKGNDSNGKFWLGVWYRRHLILMIFLIQRSYIIVMLETTEYVLGLFGVNDGRQYYFASIDKAVEFGQETPVRVIITLDLSYQEENDGKLSYSFGSHPCDTILSDRICVPN
jgi:hypothetical protein